MPLTACDRWTTPRPAASPPSAASVCPAAGCGHAKNILGCDIDKASQSSTNSWCLSSTEVPSAPWLACRTAKPVLALNTPLPSEYDA